MIAPERDPLLAAVDLLAPALAEAGLDELEVEAGDLSIRVSRRGTPNFEAAALSQAPVRPPTAPPASPPITGFPDAAPGMRYVTAPLTGVWYASPSPDARPYVQVGGELVIGQVIGLIEAMKLFNEIKSDVSGMVKRVLVENGTLVKRQQPILEVDPR